MTKETCPSHYHMSYPTRMNKLSRKYLTVVSQRDSENGYQQSRTPKRKHLLWHRIHVHTRNIRLAQTDRSAPVLYRYRRPVACPPSLTGLQNLSLYAVQKSSLCCCSVTGVSQNPPPPNSRFPVRALQLASQLASPTVVFIKLSWYGCHPVLLARQGFGVSHLSSAHPTFIAASSPRCHSPATTHSHSGPWPPRTGA